MSYNFSLWPNQPPQYSTLSRQHNPVLGMMAPMGGSSSAAANLEYESPQGNFSVSRLGQSHVLKVIRDDPRDTGYVTGGLWDVSLAQVVEKTWRAVGMVFCEGQQVGSCSLISRDLAIIPYHCIEGLDVRTLSIIFERVSTGNQTRIGTTYSVKSIFEYTAALDYAMLKIKGDPGNRHGYLPIDLEIPPSETALLHYPLGKPLQVSVNAIEHSISLVKYLPTYHDSDFGSSGGPHIAPSGCAIAMHLGSERNPMNFNLQRLALPFVKIVKQYPNSIFASIVNGTINRQLPYTGPFHFYSVPLYPHNFIDVEKFEEAKKIQSGQGWAYLLRVARDPVPGVMDGVPGVIIDAGQSKHSVWPGGGATGAGGSYFKNVTRDDIIVLGEILARDVPEFNRYPKEKKEIKPPKIIHAIEKNTPGITLGLFKTLQNSSSKFAKNKWLNIGMEAAYNEKAKSWEFHFFPED